MIIILDLTVMRPMNLKLVEMFAIIQLGIWSHIDRSWDGYDAGFGYILFSGAKDTETLQSGTYVYNQFRLDPNASIG